MAKAWRSDTTPPRIRGRQLQRLRTQLFSKQPWCVLCLRAGRCTPATIRDHIRNLADGGRDIESNTQGLCRSHSDAKTADEARRGLAHRGHR